MKRWALVAFFLAASSASAAPQGSIISQIQNSKHDFGATSAATVKASAEDQRCVFCHTPHNATPAAPLWNKTLSEGFTYQLYGSSTMKAVLSQPQAGDTSKLCLSCHDGTVALGDTVNNGLIPFQNLPLDQKLPPSDKANIAGSSLSFAESHPFSFAPDLSDAQIQLPPNGDAVKLDSQGRVQCTSCHDPHNEQLDPIERRFLVKNNSSSAICTTCHVLRGGSGANLWSWSGTQGSPSSHSTAPNTYTADTNGGVPYLGSHTGYPTVTTNGCEACHRPHSGQGSRELLKGETDQICFQCHDGNPKTGLPDLKSEFTLKIYTHPSIGAQPGHNPAEPPDNILTRHAACDDCHNPHAARPDATTPVPAQLLASLLGQSGISQTGGPHDPQRGTGDALFEYEVCLKCHSYGASKPQVPGYQVYGPLPNRQLPSTDLRQSFTSSAAFHPVINPRGLSAGPGGDVPSLLSAMADGSGAPIVSRPLSASSQIYCIDCHASDSGRNLGAGNTGPAGPHGSNVNHILERNYQIESPAGTSGYTPSLPYSSSSYALCFKCHSEQSLRNNESFSAHDEHMGFASCSTCHDPHGVPGGSASGNAALINFDLNIVAPSSGGRLEFQHTGLHQGTCYLRCHGEDHNPKSY